MFSVDKKYVFWFRLKTNEKLIPRINNERCLKIAENKKVCLSKVIIG